MAIHVTHQTDPTRFEAIVEGQHCAAEYRLVDGVMVMTHTFVPPALEGRGIAAELVGAAMAHARLHGLKVDPRCSYVRYYMKRHPETQSLHA